MTISKLNKFTAMGLIVALIITSTSTSAIYAETTADQAAATPQSEKKQIENLTNEPETNGFAGYTVKIEKGVSDEMSDDIDDSDNAEQLTDKFVQVEDPEDALEFASPDEIGYIEPNYYIYPDEVMGNEQDVISGHPNDPDYGTTYTSIETSEEAIDINQWNLEMVHAEAAWKEGLRGRGVKVGFIDTGFNNYKHQDLFPSRVLSGRSFSGTRISTDISDSSNHGTKVASVLYAATNNNMDMAGITDLASIMPLKAGNKTTLSTGADVVKAIEYARKNGIQVISMSMGMDQAYKPMEEQINYFSLNGGIFVCSGGNQARVAPRYPAGFYNTVAVSGVDKNENIWSGSNHNSTIEVAAPAKDVWHILGYRGTGTSYAAPHVSALAVIAKQYSGGKINITEFKNLLHTSSRDKGDEGRDDYYGYGIVDYEEFLNQITKDNSNGTEEVLPYPVYYSTNGGTLSGSYENFYYGKSSFKLPSVKRTGYTFQGWFANPGFTGQSYSYIPAGTKGSKRYYAKWKANRYTLKFHANKGKKMKKKSKTVTYSSQIGSMPIPKRTGYKFAGWHTKKKGGTQYSRYRKYNYTKSVTLYAHWTKNDTLTFYPNGGKVYKYKKIVKRYKKIGTLPKAYRSGYSFLGWYTKKKGGKQYTSSMKYDSWNNKKVYAHWTKRKIVKFHGNSGTVTKYAKAITKGKRLGSLPVPKRTGYKFTGWYTKKKGGSKRTKSSIVKISDSFTLYAHWKKR